MRNKNYEISSDKADNILSELDELEKLLNERVADLHEIKGMMQARHAYIFYRNTLMNARIKLRDSLKEIKEKDNG